MKITINRKTWILTLAIIFLPLSLSLERKLNVPYVGYADEIFSALMTLYLVVLATTRRLEKQDARLLALLIVYTLIGLVSNLVGKLIDNVFLISLAAFWQWKIFVSFLGAKYLSRYDRRGKLLPSLAPIAKLLIVTAFVFGILSFFVDLGMTYGKRYGIPSYSFVFGNEGRYGIIVAIALLIVLLDEERTKNKMMYVVLAIADMIFSTKGIVYIIIPIFLLLWFVFFHTAKRQKLNGPLIILIAIVGFLVSDYQITEYLMDDNAPRALLLRYGFVTANTYFPLGSGFGTYGSDVAATHYSPLYRLYGWADKWAMGVQVGGALNDNHLATIIGETGYFGLVIFLVMLYMLFLQINALKLSAAAKAMALSVFICMIVAFIATGIMKSSIGVMAFVVLGALVSESERRLSA